MPHLRDHGYEAVSSDDDSSLEVALARRPADRRNAVATTPASMSPSASRGGVKSAGSRGGYPAAGFGVLPPTRGREAERQASRFLR
jgi:hypothetical protein